MATQQESPLEAPTVASVAELYPPIEPFDTGYLKVSDIHELYYEQSGNPEGNTVVYLHGGPGSCTNPYYRRYFDPAVYRIVLYDQRGCGKSRPPAELKDNTTWHLVEDIEALRIHLNVDKWVVFGGSWGSTLALTYAIKHPSSCKALIIRGIFTLRREEVLWLYQDGASFVYPDYYDDYVAPIPKAERGDMISAYYRRLTGDDPEERLRCAQAWAQWELRGSKLRPVHENIETRLLKEDWVMAFARIECHYFVHGGWFEEEDFILNNVDKIRHIPGVIIQGRYDMITPMKTAWQLHQRYPEAEFRVLPTSGHTALETEVVTALVEATEKFKHMQ